MENTMTKEQAIAEMKKGNKITHKYFADGEWMTIQDREILLEDNVRLDYYEFWNSRFQDCWKDGYSIFKSVDL